MAPNLTISKAELVFYSTTDHATRYVEGSPKLNFCLPLTFV